MREWTDGLPWADKCRRACRVFFAILFSLVAAPASAAVTVDRVVSNNTTADSVTASSPVFSTGAGNEVLLAFIATDWHTGPNTTVTSVNGAGLTWVLVVRSNTQAGTSEIWRAFAPNPLSNVTVTATLSQAVMSSITVMAFLGADTSGTNGSGAIGAIAATNSSAGAPAGQIVTTRADSAVLGVGNDYDNAIPRTPGANQVIMHQYLTSVGDTYWVQRHLNVFPANTAVSINDTAPTSDRYNLAVVEVLASPGPQTWSMSGSVLPVLEGNGTLMFIPGALVSTTVDSTGKFTFTGMPNGTYTVRPSKPGYVFSPTQQIVTVNGANVTGINFTVLPQPTSWSISGTISPASQGGGTVLTIPGALVSTTADSTGQFSFAGMPNGTYTVRPSKAGYTFSPIERSVTVNGGNVTGVDFTAQAIPTLWTISGTVSPASYAVSANMILGESGDVLVDSAGNYQFGHVPNGTFTVVPNKPGYAFTPRSQTVTVNGGDVTGVNFTIESAGQWSASFDLGIVAANMVMTHTGNVLMYSGSSTTTATERLFNPATGQNWPVTNPYSNLFGSGHSQLADGRILVVGGYDPSALGAANANIFNPVSPSWTALPNMTYRRWHPSATTLGDGRVLVSSGAQTCLTCPADVPELFDPAANTFSALPAARLATPFYPFTFLLPDGQVINAGANAGQAVTSVLDLTTNTWATLDPNVADGHSAAMYEPGKILKSGTAADSGATGHAAAAAYVIDTTQPSPAWRQVPSMAFPRAFHNTTLLPDGTVLVTGGGTALDGYDVTKAVFEPELWSPATETWTTLSRAAIPRLYRSTALLLPDARVLVAGSGGDGTGVSQTRGEIFSPPYLFKGLRPAITAAPAVVEYGSTFTVNTPDAASIARVSLMRPGAVTHGFDQEQRSLSLPFTVGSGSIDVQAPADANLAPPGYYMLFLVNSAGVPSVAPFVQVPPVGVDVVPPTPPSNLNVVGVVGSATVTWTASADNVGVTIYRIYRSVVSGFTPGMATYAGASTSPTFTNAPIPSNTYYYKITAEDAAGNVSAPSSEASVFVPADTTPPTVSITAPGNGASVSGSIVVSANATDGVSTPRVLFKLDGQPLGNSIIAPPYSITWNSTTTSNGVHTLSAVATDLAGNTSEASVSVTVANLPPAPPGLVAAYGFNEAAGAVVTDASGQGNSGTISGATRTAAGKFGGALSFGGTSAWVTVNDAASLDLTTGMTIEAWVRPSVLTGWRSVVTKEAPDGLAYALYSGNSALRPAGYVHIANDIGVSGTTSMVANVWTHLAVTYDGTTLRLFVNGVLRNTQSAPGAAITTAGALRIGGNSVWGEYFKGLIDEVRIYNRALTVTEIQADMARAIPPG
jgi:hypothetical protein